MNQFKYKIKEKKANDLETIIEQTGPRELTLAQYKSNIDYCKKQIREMQAKRDFEEAKMKNVIINGHTALSSNELEKMNEEDFRIMFVYTNSWLMVKTADEKIKDLNEALEADSQELQKILQQTGLKMDFEDKTVKTAEDVLNLPVKKDGEIK
jgi:ABC-type molybdenum transport system ATPase subunit/photorepair protein PhrA